MIEQDAVSGKEVVALSVILGYPVGIKNNNSPKLPFSITLRTLLLNQNFHYFCSIAVLKKRLARKLSLFLIDVSPSTFLLKSHILYYIIYQRVDLQFFCLGVLINL